MNKVFSAAAFFCKIWLRAVWSWKFCTRKLVRESSRMVFYRSSIIGSPSTLTNYKRNFSCSSLSFSDLLSNQGSQGILLFRKSALHSASRYQSILVECWKFRWLNCWLQLGFGKNPESQKYRSGICGSADFGPNGETYCQPKCWTVWPIFV